jgi:ZIP family zinc transporter
MSTGEIYLLGAIAGLTIFLGLPVGRMRNVSTSAAAFLNAGAAGVLIFLLIETTEHAFEPVEEALTHVTVESGGTWGEFIGRGALFAGAFAVGLLGLVYYERWMDGRMRKARESASVGPGAASVSEYRVAHRMHLLSRAKRLALFIAIGIGLHNFAEGLAIGQSAAKGAIDFAVLLIIGFGVHNATEGFGIVAPMAADNEVPSWSFLALLGLIGGGPTFVGTVIGQSFINETVDIVFLALAAGSILYVVVQLLNVAMKLDRRMQLMWGLFAGVMFGYATELVLVAAGV